MPRKARKKEKSMSNYLFTSEAVTEGHPDKVCDRISDAVLDAVMEKDPNGRVACETCCTTGMVLVMGEMSTKAYIDIPGIVRKSLKDIGYDNPVTGFDGNTCAVMVAIDEQSPDIALGTNDEVGGAGDQGMMFGYACHETPDLMPLPISLANQMAYKLTQKRKDGTIPSILPDGKTQVTVEYSGDQKPIRIDTIVISTQHKEYATPESLEEPLVEEVITPVLQKAKEFLSDLDIDTYNLFINPTGRFVKGGPAADSGLTGRKIIVDTYGGAAAHGGGAFSGKDPTKVDRSAAYMARYIAKNIVAAELADKCQVQLAYAIGVAEPVSIRIDTFGTCTAPEENIVEAVRKVFNLTPGGIIKELDLRKPIYASTSAYGHFGNTIRDGRTWERADKVPALLTEIGGME
jgi:S-adenosylmethionine synthetase